MPVTSSIIQRVPLVPSDFTGIPDTGTIGYGTDTGTSIAGSTHAKRFQRHYTGNTNRHYAGKIQIGTIQPAL